MLCNEPKLQLPIWLFFPTFIEVCKREPGLNATARLNNIYLCQWDGGKKEMSQHEFKTNKQLCPVDHNKNENESKGGILRSENKNLPKISRLLAGELFSRLPTQLGKLPGRRKIKEL